MLKDAVRSHSPTHAALKRAVDPPPASGSAGRSERVFVFAAVDVLERTLGAGGSALFIATKAHRGALIDRLEERGVEVAKAMAECRLVVLDAEECLSLLLRNGTPDRVLFQQHIGGWVARMTVAGRELAVFGEMVSLLWARGDYTGAARLEEFWQELREHHPFALCLASPPGGASGAQEMASIVQISRRHFRALSDAGTDAPESSAPPSAAGPVPAETLARVREMELQLEREITERHRVEQSLLKVQAELDAARRDVERRITERTMSLLETNAQLEEFSYTVSHDLRAPLRGMQVYSEALCEDYRALLPSEAQHFLLRIRDNAARLESMVRDVLNFSRLSRTEIRLTPIALDGLVRRAIAEQPLFQKPRARIHLARLHPVLGHEASILQAVTNLLSNAVKFVAPGVTPEIHVWSQPEASGIRLWIEDNGIGIAPEHQSRLFRMFERVHPASVYEGTGVGLAIVRKAAQRMGGDAGIESDGTQGTRAWLQFQACPSEAD